MGRTWAADSRVFGGPYIHGSYYMPLDSDAIHYHNREHQNAEDLGSPSTPQCSRRGRTDIITSTKIMTACRSM